MTTSTLVYKPRVSTAESSKHKVIN
uniref:Uncharacterized protein n=1 Tax=Rhizophora mucronata TaxID=61149 RepID=A0A2P2NQ95_RHIMU